MGNTPSAFQYAPLGPDEIRLLRLRKRTILEDVALEMQHYPFPGSPPYIALSYTWGSPDKPKKISLNGQKIQVRENLHSFLRHARWDADAPGRERYFDEMLIENESELRYSLHYFDTLGHFWVDALCIDQSNISERNLQVTRMKDIYEHAHKVIVWLGPSDQDSDKAMELIDTLAKLEQRAEKAYAKTPIKAITDEVSKQLKNNEKSCKALGRLFHRTWWERAWVIQEVSAPTKYPTSVWCGKKRVGWNHLLLARWSMYRAILHNFSHFHAAVNSTAIKLAELKIQRGKPEEEISLGLIQLLSEARSFDTTDPRDKVYSILAIAGDGLHEDLRPDYNLSVEETYTRLAVHLIKRDNNLNILGYCFRKNNFSTPSWVPDWSVRHIPKPFTKRSFVREQIGEPTYKASNERAAEPVFSDDAKVLIVNGLVFDEVLHVSPIRALSSEDVIEEDIGLAQSWISFALDNAAQDHYIGGGSHSQALSRVICADIDHDSETFAQRGGTEFTHGPLELASHREMIVINFFSSYMAVQNTSHLRRLIRTRSGFLGIASMYTEPGDSVCILFGSSVPMVLRRLSKGWGVISECYVHGIMDGEALQNSSGDVVAFELR